MITILGCLKTNIEVSDTSIETAGFNDCREISEDNEDTNSMLVTI